MQCQTCDMRVRRNKDGTIQKHYLERTEFWTRRQKVCPGVGDTQRRICSARPGSTPK